MAKAVSLASKISASRVRFVACGSIPLRRLGGLVSGCQMFCQEGFDVGVELDSMVQVGDAIEFIEKRHRFDGDVVALQNCGKFFRLVDVDWRIVFAGGLKDRNADLIGVAQGGDGVPFFRIFFWITEFKSHARK